MNESGDPCWVSNDVPKLRNATVRLIKPTLLSVCSSAINTLSRYLCGFFENLTWILIFFCSLITIASALHQTAFLFWVSTGWMFLIMRQFWDTFWEEIKTHFSFIKLFSKCPALQFLKNSIPLDCTGLCYCVKGKAIPLQAGQAMRVQEVEVDRFKDNRHMKVVRLPALRNSRIYSSWTFPATYFC